MLTTAARFTLLLLVAHEAEEECDSMPHLPLFYFVHNVNRDDDIVSCPTNAFCI